MKFIIDGKKTLPVYSFMWLVWVKGLVWVKDTPYGKKGETFKVENDTEAFCSLMLGNGFAK